MDVMDFIGLAYIFEKKECLIDGKKQVYYKEVDSAYGFIYKFKNEENCFVILSGKLAGSYAGKNNIYKYASFKTLNQLCEENGKKHDHYKFISIYQKDIGEYFTYDAEERMFDIITDKELLKTIKAANN